MPAPRAASQSGFTILIRDLAASTVIGVHSHERAKPQPIMMDLDIEVAASRAGSTDHLAHTIDYAVVVHDLRECLAGKRYFLLERLAEYVADRILSQFDATRVWVKVIKVGIIQDVGCVGVSLERHCAPGIEGEDFERAVSDSRLTFVKKK